MRDLLHYPFLASEHGSDIDTLFILIHVFIGLFFLGWFFFFIYCLIRFRGGRQAKATYNGLNARWVYYLAGLVLVIELVLDLSFSRPYGDTANFTPEALNSKRKPLEVRVVAQQFAWNIHYPGLDGVFGTTRPELVREETNPLGLDRDDAFSQDDLTTLNQLVLPVDQPVRIYLSSKDVVHGFSLPEFRIKQDIIPGMETQILFTPTMTTAEYQKTVGDETRQFEIVCAQLCGLGHYSMRGFVTILDSDAFGTWFQQRTPHFADDYDPFWD